MKNTKRGPYKRSVEVVEEAIRLRRTGLTYAEISRRMNIPWSTISNWTQHVKLTVKVRSDKRRAYLLSHELREDKGKCVVRRIALETRGHRCERCGRKTWMKEVIVLELHRKIPEHGYTLENVELLCPNCHSLTPTWKNKKKVIAL